MSNAAPAHPFIKWVGGKTQLLPTLLQLFPQKGIKRYFEPFMGGAAVYWALAKTKPFEQAQLSDANPVLVETYTAVRDHVEQLIIELGKPQYVNTEEAFLAVRALNPAVLSLVEQGARMIYLNKTAFNGLWRVNRKGGYNVPFAHYKTCTILDEGNLRACSAALAGTEIVQRDFAQAVQAAGPGDVVYLDPPYVPASLTASFTSYSQDGFGQRDHERVALTFASLVERGATVVLSNSDTPLVRDLYAGWESRAVNVRRSVGASAATRKSVGELIVLGRKGAAAPLAASVTPDETDSEPCLSSVMTAFQTDTTSSEPGSVFIT